MKFAAERFFDDFIGYQKPPVVASGVGSRWISKTTQTSGTPTVISVTSAHALTLLLDSTSEAQVAKLTFGDILMFKLADLISVAMRIRSSAIAANEIAAWGVASGQNDTLDSVATSAWFRLAASTALKVETDDTVNDNNVIDAATTITAATWAEYVLDFSQGLKDVRFFASDANGHLKRVAAKTAFDMSNAAANYVQPYLQVQKASGATTPNLDIDYIEIQYRRS